MAYNDTVKLRAYTLFLQGTGYDEIARSLKEGFKLPSITGGTVRTWAEKADGQGETWEDHRRRVREAMRRNADETAKSRISELREKTKTIHEAIYKQLIDESGAKAKVKSFEGASYAYKTLVEFELNLDRMEREHYHPLLVIQAMLEVFQEIPSVRKAIKDNWEKIRKGIMERIGGSGVKAIEYEKRT